MTHGDAWSSVSVSSCLCIVLILTANIIVTITSKASIIVIYKISKKLALVTLMTLFSVGSFFGMDWHDNGSYNSYVYLCKG